MYWYILGGLDGALWLTCLAFECECSPTKMKMTGLLAWATAARPAAARVASRTTEAGVPRAAERAASPADGADGRPFPQREARAQAAEADGRPDPPRGARARAAAADGPRARAMAGGNLFLIPLALCMHDRSVPTAPREVDPSTFGM
jgi:hypothetical protein